MASGILKYKAAAITYEALERKERIKKKTRKEMVAGMRASATVTNIEVVPGMTSKTPVFSDNHGDD